MPRLYPWLRSHVRVPLIHTQDETKSKATSLQSTHGPLTHSHELAPFLTSKWQIPLLKSKWQIPHVVQQASLTVYDWARGAHLKPYGCERHAGLLQLLNERHHEVFAAFHRHNSTCK